LRGARRPTHGIFVRGLGKSGRIPPVNAPLGWRHGIGARWLLVGDGFPFTLRPSDGVGDPTRRLTKSRLNTED
jgi:hypothetical protein